MEIRELQENYPSIAKLIPAVETAGNPEKIIGFYTSKIEQSSSREKLSEWIKYLSKKDSMQAVLAISKLKRASEAKKEELTNIILKSIQQEPESVDKMQKLMLILLTLREFEKAKVLYKYVKYIFTENLKKMQKANTIYDINTCLMEYANCTKEYKRTFEVYEEEENIIQSIFPKTRNEEVQECKKIYDDLLNYLKEQETLLKEFNIDIDIPILHIRWNSKRNFSLNIDTIKGLKENLKSKKNESLYPIIIKSESTIKKLIEIYNEEDTNAEKFVKENLAVEQNDKNIELMYKLGKINERIISILDDYDYLQNNNIEITKREQKIASYKRMIKKIYNIFYNYRTIKTKVLQSWIDFCDDYLKIASEIRSEEEIRKNK